MPISSSTRPDPALVRTSASEQLTAFRVSPPPASDRLISDAEMEGQMRGLPDVCFQLAHTRAETAEVGSCAAVGYISKGAHAMRIYRKTPKGWSSHTFTLHVQVDEAAPQQSRRRSKGRNRPQSPRVTARPPVYSWLPKDKLQAASANGTRR